MIIKFRWNAVLDERTCPICKALHGHEWVFTVSESPLPDQLTANGQVVWNMGQGSRAHGHERFNCRCTLDFDPEKDIDFSDVIEWVEQKEKELTELTP